MTNIWSNPWVKQAFFLALLFHLSILVASIVGPSILDFKHRPITPYTVRLVEPSGVKGTSRDVPKKVLAKKIEKKQSSKEETKNTKVSKVPKKEKRHKVLKKKAVKKSLSKKDVVSLKKKNKKKQVKRARAENKDKLEKAREKKVEQRIRQIQRRLEAKREQEYLEKRLKEIASKKRGRASVAGMGKGTGARQSDKQAMIYGNFVKSKIWRNWHFPRALSDRKDLVAIVTITITKDGRLLDMKVKKYSGLAPFDRSVIKAIKDSVPLPPMPPSLGQGPEEIDIRFDLSKTGSNP